VIFQICFFVFSSEKVVILGSI